MPPHRSNKWWHHLFFFLSVSIHNAYILAKNSHHASAREKWSDLKLFIQDLVFEQIGNVWTTRQVTLVTNENWCTAFHILSKMYAKQPVCHEHCLWNAGHCAGTAYYGVGNADNQYIRLGNAMPSMSITMLSMAHRWIPQWTY